LRGSPSLYVWMLIRTPPEPSGKRPGGRRDQKTIIRTLARSLPQNTLRNHVSTQPRSSAAKVPPMLTRIAYATKPSDFGGFSRALAETVN
jgi:hypothetical protein